MRGRYRKYPIIKLDEVKAERAARAGSSGVEGPPWIAVTIVSHVGDKGGANCFVYAISMLYEVPTESSANQYAHAVIDDVRNNHTFRGLAVTIAAIPLDLIPLLASQNLEQMSQNQSTGFASQIDLLMSLLERDRQRPDPEEPPNQPNQPNRPVVDDVFIEFIDSIDENKGSENDPE